MVIKWPGGLLLCGLVVVSSSHGGGVAIGGCGGIVIVIGPYFSFQSDSGRGGG